jgi:ABC-type ATPase with predicted acetyltransferase domain
MKTRASVRALRLGAMFGIEPGRAARPPDGVADAAGALDHALSPGGIALVCGPSGAGKTAILRALARRVRARGGRVRASCPARPDRRVIDQFRCRMARAVSLLARAGLAEASLMLGRTGTLSDGQRARLEIALAMARARPSDTLILDEFGSTLDRTAATCLARTLRRWVTATPGVRAVCATAHDDLLEALAPDVLVEQALGAPAVIHRRTAA